MTGNVVYLHDRPPREVAQAVRVGFFDHRLAEHLWSANKLNARRFVFEAANVERQESLLRTLRDAGLETVLDTNVAELSVRGRFSSGVKTAPWACEGRMLDADDVVAGTNRSVIEPIARFAVAKGFTSVMSPSHYLGDESADWLSVDLKAAEAMRIALDREGGQHIALDYSLILSSRQLRDPTFRNRLIPTLASLPDGHIWLRVGGFGADATGVGMPRYIEAVRPFHSVGRPIIADHVGGIAGLAACAFGAASGFAHGIEGKQRFDARDWLTERRGGGGGRKKKVFLHGLDRSLEVSVVRRMFDDARTARQIFGCSDTACCGDIEKMLANPEAHLMVQQDRAVAILSATPESMRTDQFIEKHLESRMQEAQRATRLKKMDEDLRATVGTASKRLARTYEALRGLHKREGQPDFAPEARLRVDRNNARQENLWKRPL
ncbi:MAG: hypothetical protein H6896_13920 [Rhodovulum sp.]|nr:hypothetical protein [Rhodovulum sp.]